MNENENENENERIRFTFRCDKDELILLKMISAKTLKSSSEILSIALSEYAEKHFKNLKNL